MVIFPLDIPCCASRPAYTHNEQDIYRRILDIIPEEDLDSRNAFLSEAWSMHKEDIRDDIVENPQRYPMTVVSEEEELPNWSELSPGLREAAQIWLQQQCLGFLRRKPASEKYSEEMKTNHALFVQKLSEIPSASKLKNLLELFAKIKIACPGCALTWGLIVGILRDACNRLLKNPRDTQVHAALNGLFDALSSALKEKQSVPAHNISGLPTIVIETVRLMSTQRRREFTTRDIDSLFVIIGASSSFSVFEKAKLREKLSTILRNYSKGIGEEALRDVLLSIVKDEKRIDSLLNSVDRDVTDVFTLIDEQKGIGEKLSRYQ